MTWRALADAVLTTLLAPPCAACGAIIDTPLSGAICAPCWRAVRPLIPPLCRTCGDPLPSWRVATVGHGRCPRCRRRPTVIAAARAIGGYDGTLRQIIHAFKYDGRRSVAAPLARLMRDAGADVLIGADAVVPVALHAARQRARGFNQAADLARGLGLPVAHALHRLRSTFPQVDLPAARRHRNVRGAFAVAAGVSLSGQILVLIDDVATTGATLEACARVLKEAGAREVRALTAARVVSAPP